MNYIEIKYKLNFSEEKALKYIDQLIIKVWSQNKKLQSQVEDYSDEIMLYDEYKDIRSKFENPTKENIEDYLLDKSFNKLEESLLDYLIDELQMIKNDLIDEKLIYEVINRITLYSSENNLLETIDIEKEADSLKCKVPEEIDQDLICKFIKEEFEKLIDLAKSALENQAEIEIELFNNETQIIKFNAQSIHEKIDDLIKISYETYVEKIEDQNEKRR